MNHDRVRMARVALAFLVEPGNRDLALLIDECGPIDALDRAIGGEVTASVLGGNVTDGVVGGDVTAGASGGGVSKSLADIVRGRADGHDPYDIAADLLARTVRVGARIVTPEDDEWPIQLDDLRRISRESGQRVDQDVFPPVCLWLRGAPPLADVARRSVAVVGARASTPYGNHVATELSYGLAERGWCVVSGGAYGIDAQAHRGALTAGGCTIVVLACGIDRAYPMAHANLFERVSEDGLLLSEWPPGADPHRHRFLIRNRVIAALTRGTVVVEASARSGARQTAGRAELLGRSTMAVPGPVTSAMSVGTHQILRTVGARLVTNAAEVIEEVGRIGDDLAPLVRGRERDRDRLGATLGQVLDGVPARPPAGPQQIAAAAGLPLRVVLRALPSLRDEGFVLQDHSGWRLAPRGRAT